MSKKLFILTLDCAMNVRDSEHIIAELSQKEDYSLTQNIEEADLILINTCSVTENADKQFKQIVRKALKTNPKAFLAAVGCYAQLKPEELASVDGVDLVLGAKEKFNITQYIDDLTKNNEGVVHSCEIAETDFYVGSYSIGDRTRAFLKVQDGCDYKCTYCTIPMARGISRSDTIENILSNAKKISDKGIKEIVLTGVNIGDYGKGEFGNKKHEHTFLELVQALDKVEGIERLRISSIEPNLIKDETIDFIAQSNSFVPHFHIPLQSGSNEILKKMKRRYLRELYVSRVAKIREVMPDACIGVDVIVGFPGETDELFLETYYFLNDLDISYLHVFTYSERDNTEAVLMDGVVPDEVRAKRSKMLRGLSAKKRNAFYESQLGKEKTVLFESDNKQGYIHGFTENYVKVKAPWDPALVNTLHKVKLTKIDVDGMVRFEFV